MTFKLDENLGARVAALFRTAGHDAETVLDEHLGGADDRQVFDSACREGRCLVTLDLDFSDVLRFPPHRSAGIAVIRVPKHCSHRLLEQLVGSLLRALDVESIDSRLWIVEPGRLRVHERTGPEEDAG